MYDVIISYSDYSLDKIREKWNGELGEDVPDNIWEEAVRRVNGTTSCARLSLIQFKILHRMHFSKVKLAKIFSGVDENCSRCHSAPATLTHMFWSCSSLDQFWSGVYKTLSEMIGIECEPNVFTSIFGTVPSDNIRLSRYKDIVAFSTLIARRQILLHWKSSFPPKVSVWISDLMMFLKLEKIKYTLRGSSNRFYDVWNPLITYFENLQTLPESP